MGAIEFGAEITQESSFIEVPEGEYDFKVEDIERAQYNGSDKIPPCNAMKVNLEIAMPGGVKAHISDNFPLWDNMEWKLSEFFISIGMKKKGEPMRACNWFTEIPGRTGRCKVIQKVSTKDPNKKFSNIDRYLEPQPKNWKGGF